MSQRETRGASGELELRFEWYESGSSHLETENSLRLIAEGPDTVALVVRFQKQNFARFSDSSESTSRFVIGVDQLVELIESHGNRV